MNRFGLKTLRIAHSKTISISIIIFTLWMRILFFWIHLNVDYPFHLKGILYFPKLHRDFEVEKNTVKLYCNRVFVFRITIKDVIPNYLMALRGIIDSPDIPLNVSRSYLQMDRTVRLLSGHISKKVSDSLSMLYRNERERFIQSWNDISTVVKLGVLEDEKLYERVKDFLIWKSVDNEWMTAQEYLDRYREKTHDKIYYTKDENHMPAIMLCKKAGHWDSECESSDRHLCHAAH